jgi:PAS domain S-box-containing protein
VLRPTRKYVQIAVVFAAYLTAGRLGLATPFTSGNISPVWPAAGVALAAATLCGFRVWPGIAAGAFLVNFLSPIPHLAAVGLAFGNTLAALTGTLLLRRIPNFHTSLSRLRDVLGLIVLAALVSTMVSASVGVLVLFGAHVRPWSDVGSAWLMYWLGDGMGVLLIAPLVMTFRDLLRVRGTARIAELAVLLVLLATTSLAIFSDQLFSALRLHVLGFAVFPFVIWAAIRFGVSGCALANLLIACIATIETALGSGPFAQNSAFINAALLQVFFAVLSISGLTLAAVIAERELAERERERLSRQQLIQEARLRLAAIVESSHDAIIGKDMDGIITDWNRGAERLYGYTAQEMIGRPISLLVPNDHSDDFHEIIEKLKRGEGIAQYETMRQRKNGTRVDVSLSISLVRDGAGSPIGASTIARNISDRKQSEEALRKAEKLAVTGRLAATIAHEINNPLESLTNLFYLLSSHATLDETARRYVRIADNELKRTAHITKQMLSFYRQSSEPVPVSLAEVLDSVLDLYATKIRELSISVVKQYETNARIEGYPAELRQVFANLLGNAVEAVGDHGVIKLHIGESREWKNMFRSGVRVTVADSGGGIPPENRGKLFEPFFTTKGERGTGLGLWVSNGIIQKHEGSIHVHSSTRPGRSGTVFSVFLPRAIREVDSIPATVGRRSRG